LAGQIGLNGKNGEKIDDSNKEQRLKKKKKKATQGVSLQKNPLRTGKKNRASGGGDGESRGDRPREPCKKCGANFHKKKEKGRHNHSKLA